MCSLLSETPLPTQKQLVLKDLSELCVKITSPTLSNQTLIILQKFRR